MAAGGQGVGGVASRLRSESVGTGVTRRGVLLAGLGAGAAMFGLAAKVHAARSNGCRIVGPLPDTREKGLLVWNVEPAGYRADEYFLSGFANVYAPVSMADAPTIFSRDSTADFAVRKFDPHLRSPSRPYTTRLVVYGPKDPSRFSGNVIVETLHPAGGGRGIVWDAVHPFFTKNGDAYIGVQHPLTFAGLQAAEPSRYRALQASDPTQLWGMLIDAGSVIRRHDGPLGRGVIRHVLMTGYSFTGVATATFANYHHERAKLPNGTNVFDAYLPMADAQYVRPLDVPVMRLNTQSDFNGFGGLNNRRPDDPRYRHYEVAGACHVAVAPPPGAALAPPVGSLPTPAGQPTFSAHKCDEEFPKGGKRNDFPLYLFQESLFQNMYDWLDGSGSPPPSRYIEATSQGETKLDQWGNAMGGVRYPQISVPIARYGVDSARDCILFGFTVPFEAALCRRLYRSRGHYLSLVEQATAHLARARLIRNDGADRLVAIAHASANF